MQRKDLSITPDPVILLVLLLLGTASMALAQKDKGENDTVLPPRAITGFSLTIDQDAFFIISDLNKDQNYTIGLNLLWAGMGTNRYFLLTPALLNGIDAATVDLFWPNRLHRSDMVISSFAFGFSGFTPENLTSSEIVYDDRPYSSVMYFQSGRAYYKPKLNKHFAASTSFSLQILGTHLGKSVQTAIHYLQSSTDQNDAPVPGTARPIPKGWSNQIGNGGGISATYSYDLLYRPWDNKWFDHNFHLIGGTDIGLYTNLNAGFGAMLGKVERPWFLPVNQNSGTDQFVASQQAKKLGYLLEQDTIDNPVYEPYWIKKPFIWELFLKMECRGFLWADNGLLTGNTVIGPKPFEVNDPGSKVEMSHFTYEVFAALVLRLQYLDLSYGAKFRSRELNYTDGRPDQFRNHLWGHVSLGWRL